MVYVFRFTGHKGKAGITEVMEYRAAAAATAGQTDVLSSSFHTPRITLFTGFARVQSPPYPRVAPQEQHALRGHLAENTHFSTAVLKPGS